MADPDPGTRDASGGERAPRADGAAPHQAPFPTHVPRWLAWVLLVALASSGVVCVRAAIGG